MSGDLGQHEALIVIRALKELRDLQGNGCLDADYAMPPIQHFSEYGITPIDLPVKQKDGPAKMVKVLTAPLMKSWFHRAQENLPVCQRVSIITAPLLVGNAVIVIGAAFIGTRILSTDFTKGSLNEQYGIEKLTTRCYLRLLKNIGFVPDFDVMDDDDVFDNIPASFGGPSSSSAPDPLTDFGNEKGGSSVRGTIVDLGSLPKTYVDRVGAEAATKVKPQEPPSLPDDDDNGDDVIDLAGGSATTNPKPTSGVIEL